MHQENLFMFFCPVCLLDKLKGILTLKEYGDAYFTKDSDKPTKNISHQIIIKYIIQLLYSSKSTRFTPSPHLSDSPISQIIGISFSNALSVVSCSKRLPL